MKVFGMTNFRRKVITWSIVLLVAVFVGYGINFYIRTLTARPGDVITTPVGVKIEKPAREIKSFKVENGDIIAYYTDETSEFVGRMPEAKDGVGLAPTKDQIDIAIQEYCSNGACKGDNVSSQQVFTAVSRYCNGGICKGDNASPVTSDMIVSAVAQFCSNTNVCKGANGDDGDDGTDGTDGRTPMIDCVMRWDETLPTVTRYYWATKYTDEDNTKWVNKTRINSADRIPGACIDLRT